MEFQTTSSRPRSIDLPQPETGLAEWMSKIKAMQRQVDADDETEQRKLEEEIAASRLARLRRRSHGAGSSSPTSSLDLSRKAENTGVPKSDVSGRRSGDDLPVSERQEDALRKLMGNRDNLSPTRPTTMQEKSSISPQSRSRPESMSLAAFMGGRATGPRLNKHAPQQDAHDPTQFEQRTRVDAPHPIFGRGGIAMPGMTAKEKTPSLPADSPQGRDAAVRSHSAGPMQNQRKASGMLPVTKLHVADVEDQPSVVPKFGNAYGSRARGASISDGNPRAKSPYLLTTPNTEREALTKKRSHSPSSGLLSSRGKTPEPALSPQKPISRPVSRGYELSNTYRGSSPNPARSTDEQTFGPPSLSKKPDPVSLAAFMGGRATGPRLNRHAPQQDAHDPTQFEQRTNITAPHPVFGKGGVAMPGMAAKDASSAMFRTSTQLRSAVDASQSASGRSEEQPATSFHTGNRVGSRERTVSTPGRATSRSTYSEGDYMKPNYIRRPVSHTSIRDTRPKTPTSDMSSPSPSPPTVSHSYTSRQRSTSTSGPSLSQKPAPVTTPSLARPIQPVPRQPTGPQIPASTNPSRAFLRPPLGEKELTPSLNKLKGRGFVQSMIKTSSQLEASASEFGATPATAEKVRATRPRKSSVLDRWQPAASAGSTSVSPPISPKPIPIRKSHTIDPSMTSPTTVSGFPSPSKSDTNKQLKTTTSHSPMSQAETPRPPSRTSKKNDIPITMPPQDTPGLGSSSTLISYIKPTKTGDDPVPPPAVVPPKVRTSFNGVGQGTKTSSTSDLSVTPGLPLKHPTKGRARKPRNDRDTKQVQFESTSSAAAAVTQSQIYPRRTASSVVESLVPLPVSNPQIINRSTNGNIEQSQGYLSPNDSQPSVSRISDRWADQAIIGVKSASPKPIERISESAQLGPSSLLDRRALPGMTTSSLKPLPGVLRQENKPDRYPPTPLSPGRHARVPGTGHRERTMDVAQGWDEHRTRKSTTSDNLRSDESTKVVEALPEDIPQPEDSSPLNVQGQKRKSSHEMYSGINLPSLQDQKTPESSPQVTLSRRSAQKPSTPHNNDLRESKPVSSSDSSPVLAFPVDTNIVQFEHVGEPLPELDISSLLPVKATEFVSDPDESTISVEVMVIAKSSASSISKDTHIFYDTEVLAIIHRSKSKSSGLASTKLWSWQGKRSQLGAKEATKLQELAERYQTSLENIFQYEEPSNLVHLLGGQLAIRQGIRPHWTSENTAMHSVRSYNDFILIEEHDLNVTNLCSGFSFCLTILDTLYVWYGRGSRQLERVAALKYAQSLAAKGSTVVELAEGETDDDEMFWTMLGDNEYAKADYWKWRRIALNVDPRAWQIDSTKGQNTARFLSSFSREYGIQNSVYIIDCVWEYFVLVGENARGKRRNIRLAISTAQKMSHRLAKSRPFSPTVHVLILPSKLPLDLRLHFRDLDESRLNHDKIPDHMNILSSAEALEHLQRTSWEKVTLRDPAMLPLGLDPSTIP